MKNIVSLLSLLVGFSVFSQELKPITIEGIWEGVFSPENIHGFHSMKDGQSYLRINRHADRSVTLDKYSFQTLEKTATLLNSAELSLRGGFNSYIFDESETKLLIETATEPIYRHSKKGLYKYYDLQAKTLLPLSEKMVQEPAFSSDGKRVAYVFENNIYIKDFETGQVTQVTQDGEKNKIINGLTDWVYEEEFSFVRAYEWNASGDKIAFIRFDESQVPEFSMDIYSTTLYPKAYKFKYPKAGERNSEVSLHIYDLSTGHTTQVATEAYYIPAIKWTKDPGVLTFQELNRRQNHLTIKTYNLEKQQTATLLEEKDPAYIDIEKNDLRFLPDGGFLWASERDGYNHIYRYSKTGRLINQVTKGPWDVTKLYGYSPSEKAIYYQSTRRGSIYRDIYKVKLNGKDEKNLTADQIGTNWAQFSADMSYYVNAFSGISQPPIYTLHKSDGRQLKEIFDNKDYRERMKSYQLNKKEISTIEINGNRLNMYMIKPSGFDASKKYPLLLFQYSGPGSQQVSDQWFSSNDFWHMLLAEKGYIVACVDGRGTGFKGAAFKKTTYKQLGKYEVEDQIAFAEKLGDMDYIDASRIGIWGWSFGGFMSANCILKGNDTFKMAIAVAPVTSWRFYDTIYTERYMQTPQENASGYDDNSPLNFTNRLKGRFLLVHGSADDNVHLQNTMRLVENLVQGDKSFEWAIYPDKNHGIYGGATRVQLYKKMTDFIKTNL